MKPAHYSTCVNHSSDIRRFSLAFMATQARCTASSTHMLKPMCSGATCAGTMHPGPDYLGQDAFRCLRCMCASATEAMRRRAGPRRLLVGSETFRPANVYFGLLKGCCNAAIELGWSCVCASVRFERLRLQVCVSRCQFRTRKGFKVYTATASFYQGRISVFWKSRTQRCEPAEQSEAPVRLRVENENSSRRHACSVVIYWQPRLSFFLDGRIVVERCFCVVLPRLSFSISVFRGGSDSEALL